jgi:hypothetical protein
MTPQQADDRARIKERNERLESSDLDSRYGSIGIQAVAAAARYPSSARDLTKPKLESEKAK